MYITYIIYYYSIAYIYIIFISLHINYLLVKADIAQKNDAL